MVSIRWCLKQRQGLRIVEPNENASGSYLGMAEESIKALGSLGESRIWTATTSYYIFYYSLYALMLRIGVKCGIHSCSIEFMKRRLRGFYSRKDMEMMEMAFSARTDLQYYADRPVDDGVIEKVRLYCKDFYIRTKDILSGITHEQIAEIRREVKKAR